MKIKFLLLVAAVFITIGVNAQDTPFRFGVKAGANLSNFSGSDADGSDAKFGFNAGVTVDYAINSNWLIMSGLEFTTKGAKADESVSLDDFDIPELTGSVKIKTTVNAMYLQLPIHAGYSLPVSEGVNLLFHAGPYFAYGVGGKAKVKANGQEMIKIDTFDDNFAKRFDFGLGLGAGVEFGKINAGIGYDFGLVNIMQDGTMRNMNGYLSVGYKF